MDQLTNTELAILGLVAEGPRYGYQIEQDIEARGMRNWTEIGFSSIYYILNKLESSGWLESQRQIEEVAEKGRGLARRVYRLTESGQVAFREAVHQRLSHPRPRTGDFDLGLANLPALTPEESIAALQTYREDLKQRLEGVRAKWQADRAAAGPFFPPHVSALFEHSLAMIAADLAWVEQYLADLSKQPEGKS